MKQIKFTIPGEPVGKARPRMTRQGHAYTPAKTRNAEAFVKLCAMEAMNGAGLLDMPVMLTLDIRCSVPPSWSQRRKVMALANGITPGKPDIDNIAKLVADALNGIVLVDDRQICRLYAVKRYADEPGIDVAVETFA